MKQFLIVLLATAAVFVGWKVYSTSSDEAPKTDRRPISSAKPPKTKRPKTGLPTETVRVQTPDGEVEVERYVGTDAIRQEELEAALSAESSWTQYVQDDDIVKLEDAWALDFGDVDFDAEVLVTIECSGGQRVEITQNDWRRYVCLTLGLSLVRTKLLADRARVVSESFGEPYGLPDDVWPRFLAGLAKSRGMTVDEYKAHCAQNYGLDEEGAVLARRYSIEGLFSHLPPVNEAGQLPRLTRQSIENEKDQALLMTLAAAVREARKDLQNEEKLDALASLVGEGIVHLVFTRSMPEHEFRHTWSFLDGELPADAVAGVTLSEIETEELRPPWLQPGAASFVTVDEVWPHIPDLMGDQGVGMLRELTWYLVLRSELENAGQKLTPEETWLRYADEYMRRDTGVLNMSAYTSTIALFPSTHHYRAFSGVFWAFEDHQPEGWDSEANLRSFYDRNRVFVESWLPSLEAILFPAVKFEEGYAVDWEGARQRAEEARAQLLAGKEDFSALRNQLHLEHRERLLAAGLHDLASSFEESFQNGMLAARMPKLERSFAESAFSLMIDTASLVRNSVARLDPGEISPIWRVPIGYTIVRVHGVVAADLEGTYDDHEFETKFEFSRAKFRQWANALLRDVKLLE